MPDGSSREARRLELLDPSSDIGRFDERQASLRAETVDRSVEASTNIPKPFLGHFSGIVIEERPHSRPQ